MKMCWNLEPTERPTFSKITQMIERLLGDQAEQEQVSECEAGFSDSSLALPKQAKHVTLQPRCPQETLLFFPPFNSLKDTIDLAVLSNQLN